MAPGLAALDVELPAVPRAAQHLAVPLQPVFAGPVGREAAQDRADAQWRTFVRAAVDQCVEFILHIEDADLASGDGDDFAGTRRDLADGRDNVPGHAVTPGRRTT